MKFIKYFAFLILSVVVLISCDGSNSPAKVTDWEELEMRPKKVTSTYLNDTMKVIEFRYVGEQLDSVHVIDYNMSDTVDVEFTYDTNGNLDCSNKMSTPAIIIDFDFDISGNILKQVLTDNLGGYGNIQLDYYYANNKLSYYQTYSLWKDELYRRYRFKYDNNDKLVGLDKYSNTRNWDEDTDDWVWNRYFESQLSYRNGKLVELVHTLNDSIHPRTKVEFSYHNTNRFINLKYLDVVFYKDSSETGDTATTYYVYEYTNKSVEYEGELIKEMTYENADGGVSIYMIEWEEGKSNIYKVANQYSHTCDVDLITPYHKLIYNSADEFLAYIMFLTAYQF